MKQTAFWRERNGESRCLYKGALYSYILYIITVSLYIIYRMAEKSPYTDQYATIIRFESLSTPWLHVQWIRICTLMLDTQTDAPPCPLWHMSVHFWSNCTKGVFHSSVQIFVVVVVVATRSHSSLDNTPQRVVWCGKVRTTWWSWQWCRRCRWATANRAAWKTFVQNIAHRKSEVCGCPMVL